VKPPQVYNIQNHEPSAWLRATATRQLRKLEAANVGDVSDDPVIMLSLGRSPFESEREDRTCDRCRRFVPIGEMFYPFCWETRSTVVTRVFITGGFCGKCNTLEGWTA
jgi:hypothetical protein